MLNERISALSDDQPLLYNPAFDRQGLWRLLNAGECELSALHGPRDDGELDLYCL